MTIDRKQQPDRCPACYAPSTIIDSRKREKHIFRRRECRNQNCLHRWSTYEIFMEEYHSLKEISDLYEVRIEEQSKRKASELHEVEEYEDAEPTEYDSLGEDFEY